MPEKSKSRNGVQSGKAAKSVHPSVQSLMAEALPGDSAEDVIRRKCREMVARAKALGWEGPPYDPRILASLHRIKVVETNEDFGSEGRIFATRSEVRIEYRAGILPERQRFTIFHELAHTCFPDAYEFVRNRLNSPDDDEAYNEFERLCDKGAGELLIPEVDLVSDLAESIICMGNFHRLSKRYEASIDATLRRILDKTEHPCAAVFLTDAGFDDFEGVKGRLRVQYMWRSRAFKGYIPKGELLPKGTRCARQDLDLPGQFLPIKETWWVKNRPFSYYVEPLRLPQIAANPNYPKCVALIHSRIPKQAGTNSN